jgi:hypothetical protein
MSDHPAHLWHLGVDGVVRCSLMGWDAEPTELDAAQTELASGTESQARTLAIPRHSVSRIETYCTRRFTIHNVPCR